MIQAPVQKALEAFERLRKDFPGSRYDGPALQKIQECHDLLAQTHLFVGQFYYRRGSYLAAAHRFEQIMKLYPDKSIAPDALYFLALSYHDLGADDWASEQLTLLAEKYPDSASSSDGKSLLAKIGGGKPATLLAKKIAPEPTPSSTPIGYTPIGKSTESCRWAHPLWPGWIVPPPFRHRHCASLLSAAALAPGADPSRQRR